MRLSQIKVDAIALAVRDHITPALDRAGCIENEELAQLVKRHTPHSVRTEHNLTRIQQALVEL